MKDKSSPERGGGDVRAIINRWLTDEIRISGLELAIERGSEDARVAFCVMVDIDSRYVVDVIVCPPVSVDWLAAEAGRWTGLRIMALDFHVTQRQAETQEQKQRIARECERIIRGWAMLGELMPSYLHARRYALRAAGIGTTWGTDLDIPPDMRRGHADEGSKDGDQ